MIEVGFENILRNSVRDVLEKMFFVEALEGASEAADPSGIVAVKLTFEGSPSGALTLRITETSARQIAADFLGTDPSELSSAQIGEVICELANMICGSVLSQIEATSTFRLATPRVLFADQWQEGAQPDGHHAVHAFQIGTGTLTAAMETREAV